MSQGGDRKRENKKYNKSIENAEETPIKRYGLEPVKNSDKIAKENEEKLRNL